VVVVSMLSRKKTFSLAHGVFRAGFLPTLMVFVPLGLRFCFDAWILVDGYCKTVGFLSGWREK